jgi:hypothetical protein
MGEFGNASASYKLTDRIQTVLVPGWPIQPQLVAREDGLDKVTITVPKCHDRENWNLVAMRGGDMLVAHAYLTGGQPGGSRRIQRTNHNMMVLVPPSRLKTFQVLTERPGATDK